MKLGLSTTIPNFELANPRSMDSDRLSPSFRLKYGMPDLRPYFEADAAWTRHYGFKPWLTPSVSGGLS